MKRKRHHYPYLPTRILSPPSAFTITYQSSNLTYQSSNLTLNHHTTILNPKIIDPTHQKILRKEREKESKTGINASLPSLPPFILLPTHSSYPPQSTHPSYGDNQISPPPKTNSQSHAPPTQGLGGREGGREGGSEGGRVRRSEWLEEGRDRRREGGRVRRRGWRGVVCRGFVLRTNRKLTIRPVTDITTHADSHIPTNGTRHGSSGVGRPEEDTAGFDGVFAFPDHGDDGPGGEVGDEALFLFWGEGWEGEEGKEMRGGGKSLYFD